MRLSIVVEWANTRLHGTSRARRLLEVLERQWREIVSGEFPEGLPPEAAAFLKGLEPRAELVIASGDATTDLDPGLRRRLSTGFDVGVHVGEGLEYYPLKNFGARHASGDLLLFLDSDVLPDEGWLAHLLGSFARPDVQVVCGQTYVAPEDLVSRAFAVGWTYALRDPEGGLIQPRKFYANNMAFRAPLFRRVGFRSVGLRSRGACNLLREDLAELGLRVWENRSAGAAHPPPAGLRHMTVRALAHGRDHCMKRTQERSLAGARRAVGVAWLRLGRGFRRTFRERRQVGLRRRDVPAALAIIASYYAIFALGGVLTFVHPGSTTNRFRV